MGKYDWVLSALEGLGFRDKLSLINKFMRERKKIPDIVKCSLCPNMCRFNCPIAVAIGSETISPAGKARIAMAIEKGYLDPTIENVLPLYYCMSCGACKAYCVFEYNVSELIIPLKKELYEKKLAPKEVFELAERIRNNRTTLKEKPQGKSRDGKILLLLGDKLRAYYPDLEEKYVEFMEKLGFKVKTLEIEPYCGLTPYYAGMSDIQEEVYNELKDVINKEKVDAVVVIEPSCAYLLREILPKLGMKVKKKVYHITEFLQDKKIDFRNTEKVEITIHTPCSLVHGLGKPDLLKTLLEQIPGVKVNPPFRDGINSYCIDGGEVLKLIDRKAYDRLLEERARELKEESDIVVTACIGCKKELESKGLKVYDLMEFMLSRL